MSVNVLENVGFHVGPRGYIHDLKDRLNCEMVIQRISPGHEVGQATKQVFKPEVRAYAFVERIFVQDHFG